MYSSHIRSSSSVSSIVFGDSENNRTMTERGGESTQSHDRVDSLRAKREIGLISNSSLRIGEIPQQSSSLKRVCAIPKDPLPSFRATEYDLRNNFKGLRYTCYSLRTLAEVGDVKARYELGIYYFQYLNDKEKAFKWWFAAALEDHNEAQYRLGECYYRGEGIIEDKFEAVNLWTMAASKGNELAQCRLAECHFEGIGVSQKCIKTAVLWWKQAAKKRSLYAPLPDGNPVAQYRLGLFYYYGQDGVIRKDKAVKWWKRAEKHSLAEAIYNLGFCYFLGEGVALDTIEARKKWISAMKLGFELAKKALNDMQDNKKTLAWQPSELIRGFG